MSDQNLNLTIKAIDQASGILAKVKTELAGLNTAAKQGASGAASAMSGVTTAMTAPVGAIEGLKGRLAGLWQSFTQGGGATNVLKSGLSALGGLAGSASGALSTMGSALTGITGGALATGGAIGAIVIALGSMAKTAQESAARTAEIGKVIRALGGDVQALTPVINGMVKSLALGSTMGKDEIVGVWKLMSEQMGKVVTDTNKVKLAMDTMSSGIFRTSRQAGKALADAFQGSAKELMAADVETKKYVEGLAAVAKEAGHIMTEQEKATAALEHFKEKVRGLSDQTTELGKAQNQLNDAWGKFSADVGPGLLKIAGAFLEVVQQIIVGWQNIFNVISMGVDKAGQMQAKQEAAIGINAKSIARKGELEALERQNREEAIKFGQEPAAELNTERIENLRAKWKREDALEKHGGEGGDLESKLQSKETAYGAAHRGKELPISEQLKYWQQAQREIKNTSHSLEDEEKIQQHINELMRQQDESGQSISKTSETQYEIAKKQSELSELKTSGGSKLAEDKLKLADAEKDLKKARGTDEQIDAYKRVKEAQNAVQRDIEEGNKKNLEGAKKQQKAEQEISEARKKGYQEGKAEGEKYYQEMYSQAEETKNKFAADELKLDDERQALHKENAEWVQKGHSLEVQNRDLIAEIGQLQQTENMTLADKQKLYAKINTTLGNIKESQLEQSKAMVDSFREQTLLSNELNNKSGLAAQANIYSSNQQLISGGNVLDMGQLRQLMAENREFIQQIEEQFGLTETEALAIAPAIGAWTPEMIKAREEAANMKKEFEGFRETIQRRKELGIDASQLQIAESERDFFKEQALRGGGIQAAQQYKYYSAKAEQLKAIDEASQKQKQLSDELYRGTESALSSAFMAGFEHGGKDAVKSFTDYLKNSIMKSVADGLAAAMMGGASGTNPLFGLFGGGKLGGGAVSVASSVIQATGAKAGPVSSATGLTISGLMPSLTVPSLIPSPIDNSGLLNVPMENSNLGMAGAIAESATATTSAAHAGGLLGKMGLGGGSGAFGILTKVLPMLTAVSLISGFFKKGAGAPMSGQAALPQFSGINNLSGGFDILRGSDFFQRAAFSARNTSGALAGKMMQPYSGAPVIQQTIKITPGGMFNATVQNETIKGVQTSAAAGVPRRTGFSVG